MVFCHPAEQGRVPEGPRLSTHLPKEYPYDGEYAEGVSPLAVAEQNVVIAAVCGPFCAT